MSAIRTFLSLAVLVAATAVVQAAPPPLVEFETGKEKLQGRVDAHSDELFWLMGQDGRLRGLAKDKVKKYRQVSPRFSSYSATVLRDQLRRELGKSFDVVGTRHYTVCAAGDRKARTYAETFEELYRSFQGYFSVRGFKVNEPEFPLVAIIFPDYESFSRYADAEGVSASKTLKGYYLSTSNRVALYEDPATAAAQQSLLDGPVHRDLDSHQVDSLTIASGFTDSSPLTDSFSLPLRAGGLGWAGERLLAPHDHADPCPSTGRGSADGAVVNVSNTPFTHSLASFGDGEEPPAWLAIEGSLKDTMIHEATHQVAFNTGLHSRIGPSPKWVVEGLATVFEAPGIRNTSSNASIKTRINRQRFIWFGNFKEHRRRPKSLEGFLASDDFFKSDVLDAYSEAWAFSFFLIETRPRPYADYLRAIAARDPLEAYPPQARLADFKKTVSKEIPLLEAEYLRFMAGIK